MIKAIQIKSSEQAFQDVLKSQTPGLPHLLNLFKNDNISGANDSSASMYG